MSAAAHVPYVSTACPICGDTVQKTETSPLIREMHRHVIGAHREELRSRLDNPKDPIIALLWDDFAISLRRGDL